MIRKLSTLLALTACLVIPEVLAALPGLSLVTSRTAPAEDDSFTMYVRSIPSLDRPETSIDVELILPKPKGIPHTGVNNCGFIARHVQMAPDLHLVATIDGQIYLFKTQPSSDDPSASCTTTARVGAINLKAWGMDPLLQKQELLTQIKEVFPYKDDDPKHNAEREAFVLRNLAMPIHFSRPFLSSDSKPTVFVLADNKVYTVAISNSASDMPSLGIQEFPDESNNTCYRPVTTSASQPWTLASVLATGAGKYLNPAPGRSKDELTTEIFSEYATGISWEKTTSGFTLIVTLDSRNGEYATNIDYLPNNEPPGCNGKGIIMRQFTAENDGSPETPCWKKHAYADLTTFWPRPGEEGKLMANSCHSMLTTEMDDIGYMAVQLHHHKLAFAPMTPVLTPEQQRLPSDKASAGTNPIKIGHSPFLFYGLPAAIQDDFCFPFYMSGRIRAEGKINRASANRLQIPAQNGHVYVIACSAFNTDAGDREDLKIDGFTRGGVAAPCVVSITTLDLTDGIRSKDKVAISYEKEFQAEKPVQTGRIGIPKGADHPYDIGRILTEFPLKPLAIPAI